MKKLYEETDIQAVADAIREKNGSTDTYKVSEMAQAVKDIPIKKNSASVGDINFCDYDGTILYSWALSELAEKTELPPLPTQNGLICQGWNWTLADLQEQNSKMTVGALYTTIDGKTRVYVELRNGCLSPKLGLYVNGSVTVDWGDGLTDTLSGTSLSTVQWTPIHNYATQGSYIIALSVNGTAALGGVGSTGPYLLCHENNTASLNKPYQSSIRRVEVGDDIKKLEQSAFQNCLGLTSISLPSTIEGINHNVFYMTSINFVTIPSGIRTVGNNIFRNTTSLTSVSLPKSFYAISSSGFQTCSALVAIDIPNGVNNIYGYSIAYCPSLTIIRLPSSLKLIQSAAFRGNYGAVLYDFSSLSAVPTLENTNSFADIPATCEIRVPASLLEEWKSATNWSTYADQIKPLSEYVEEENA